MAARVCGRRLDAVLASRCSERGRTYAQMEKCGICRASVAIFKLCVRLSRRCFPSGACALSSTCPRAARLLRVRGRARSCLIRRRVIANFHALTINWWLDLLLTLCFSMFSLQCIAFHRVNHGTNPQKFEGKFKPSGGSNVMKIKIPLDPIW